MTHICVGNTTIIGLDNGLSPRRHQAINWTNAGILSIGTLGANFSENVILIHISSLKKMHLKMSSGKWRPFSRPQCVKGYILTAMQGATSWMCKFVRRNMANVFTDMITCLKTKFLIIDLCHWNQWESLCIHRQVHDWNSHASSASRYWTRGDLPFEHMMTSSNGHIFRVTGHLCGEFTVPGEFPAQRPVTQRFNFFHLRPNKWLSKQWSSWWFETPSRPLWRHRNEMPAIIK